MKARTAILLSVLMVAACTDPTVEIGAEPAMEVSSAGEVQAKSPVLPRERNHHVPAVEVLSAGHRNLIALSEAEAAWLNRNGYPTEDELEQIASLDIRALESAMRDRRDGKSAALVGARRLHEGNLAGAISAFARGSELGSLYARQELAKAELMAATGLPQNSLHEAADQASLTTFVAQMEVARIMGDHRAKDNIARYAGEFDWTSNSRAVLAQVVESMRQYAADAAVRGVPAAGPDLRPNADLWLQLKTDPKGSVVVYRRP